MRTVSLQTKHKRYSQSDSQEITFSLKTGVTSNFKSFTKRKFAEMGCPLTGILLYIQLFSYFDLLLSSVHVAVDGVRRQMKIEGDLLLLTQRNQ
jgi:hypothetical protein